LPTLSSVAGRFELVQRPAKSLSPMERPLARCPRLKLRGVLLFVDLLPDAQWCFDCARDARRRGTAAVPAHRRDLPYPALLPFVQSLLDRAAEVDLADLVDGLNLPMQWADEAVHVDDGSSGGGGGGGGREEEEGRLRRISWAPTPRDWKVPFAGRTAASKRAMWEHAVDGRQARMGYKYPADVWVTRFMTRRRWERILAGEAARSAADDASGANENEERGAEDTKDGVAAAIQARSFWDSVVDIGSKGARLSQF
jgi:hypothetical protein